jgi:hypothetical protein
LKSTDLSLDAVDKVEIVGVHRPSVSSTQFGEISTNCIDFTEEFGSIHVLAP